MNDRNGIRTQKQDILIIDDFPANLRILDEILTSEGYKVRPVLNGINALQSAEIEKPDLVLLDIMMPEIDGFEVCRQFKANPNLVDVPIIFISALNNASGIARAFTEGGIDYITKPFQAEEVKARVFSHLKFCRQQKELQDQKSELLELNAMKDKFFSIIAHDLRGPLGGIMGITEMMAD